MNRTSLLWLCAFCVVLSIFLHFSADIFYFYWIFWWYDFVVHFFVGFTGGLGLYWGLFYSGLFFKAELENKKHAIFLVFFCVMIWGVSWEIFEYVYGIIDSHEGYILDTVSDLILDGSGGILASILALRKW